MLLELERDGVVLRGRFDGREGWCDRRLLARIHRYTLERLRKEIEPVTASEFLRFRLGYRLTDRSQDDGFSANEASARKVSELFFQAMLKQDRSAWTWEVELRPWVETF